MSHRYANLMTSHQMAVSIDLSDKAYSETSTKSESLCFVCGKSYKYLRTHLKSHKHDGYKLTQDQIELITSIKERNLLVMQNASIDLSRAPMQFGTQVLFEWFKKEISRCGIPVRTTTPKLKRATKRRSDDSSASSGTRPSSASSGELDVKHNVNDLNEENKAKRVECGEHLGHFHSKDPSEGNKEDVPIEGPKTMESCRRSNGFMRLADPEIYENEEPRTTHHNSYCASVIDEPIINSQYPFFEANEETIHSNTLPEMELDVKKEFQLNASELSKNCIPCFPIEVKKEIAELSHATSSSRENFDRIVDLIFDVHYRELLRTEDTENIHSPLKVLPVQPVRRSQRVRKRIIPEIIWPTRRPNDDESFNEGPQDEPLSSLKKIPKRTSTTLPSELENGIKKRVKSSSEIV